MVQISEAALIEFEKAVSERDVLKPALAARVEEVAGLREALNAQKGLIDAHKAIADTWKRATEEGKLAQEADAKRIASYERSKLDFEANTTRLMNERDSARRDRLIWSIVGVGVGVFIGRESVR